ncbi:MAG: efflux RND transporter periplasmic adaptor subunit [Pseudomonadota bacterium]
MTDQGEIREKKPTAIKGLLFLIVMLIVAAALLALALSRRSEEGPQVVKTMPTPISVATEPVAIQTSFELRELYSGLAAPRRTSQLGFQSGGRISAISADVGDPIRQGAVLARLDTRALNAQLASAEAVVEEARAGYALARNTVDRQRTLQGRGHVSQQAVDEAEAQAATAFARIEAAKAQSDTLRVQIDLARIVAPFDGVVTSRMADEGAIAAPGTPVLELVENGRLEARVGLPASLAATLETGADYILSSDAGDVRATLRASTGVIGSGDRTVSTVFDIANAGDVPAGAVVRLGLDRDLDARGAWVPIASLSESTRGLWSVFVAQPGNEGTFAERRLVEIIHSSADRAYVRGALEDGDLIITDGLQRITPGQPVAPRTDRAVAQTVSPS